MPVCSVFLMYFQARTTIFLKTNKQTKKSPYQNSVNICNHPYGLNIMWFGSVLSKIQFKNPCSHTFCRNEYIWGDVYMHSSASWWLWSQISEGMGMGGWVMGMMYVVMPLAQNCQWGVCIGGEWCGEVLGGCWSEGDESKGGHEDMV